MSTTDGVVATGRPRLVLLDGVRWDGEPIAGERLAALLGLLAQAAPRAVPVEELIGRIWDDPPAHPEKALQVLVSRARSRTAAEVITLRAGGYRLGLAPGDVDVLHLRACVADARAAHGAGDLDVARLAARDALAIDVGSAAEGVPVELFAEARRSRDIAREVLGECLSARGDFAQALELLEAVSANRPDDEELLTKLIRAEAEVRGVPSALQRWATHAEQVRETVGAEPGVALRRLHTELLARDAPVRAGLRYDASPLMGRDEDIAALRSALHRDRVVSIVGAGGLGKTRMAHLLGRLASEPVVHFVELVGVRAPEGILPQVASALGVAEPSGSLRRTGALRDPDLWNQVLTQFGAPTLLILDNCEHLIDAVADLVAALVGVTDTVRVLTTSRAPLGIAAEHVYQLPQLPIDDAVELFGIRARSARAGVSLDEAEVTGLVSRLDGLPLAIELAAAKTRLMSVAEITRRLSDRFALLATGDRSAPDRHRTLEAVIAWSWNLLDEADQRGLTTLAALPDGFGLDSAEVLLGERALTCLAELVDQSLLVVSENDDGVRYRFLETVREFGLKQLDEAGAAAEVAAAVDAWAVGFAADCANRLFSPDQIRMVGRIGAEEGNLVAVLRSALERTDASVAVPLMAALSGYWTIRGQHFSMLAFAGPVLDTAARAPLPSERERATWRAVVSSSIMMLSVLGEFNDTEAIGLLESLGESGDGGATDAMRRVVLTLTTEQDPRQSLADLAGSGNPQEQRTALSLLAHLRENAGDVGGAIVASSAALQLTDAASGPWIRAQLQSQLSSLCAAEEDLPAAAAHAEAATPVIAAVRAHDDLVQLTTVRVLADLVEGRRIVARERLDRIEAEVAQGLDGDLDTRLTLLMCRAELLLAEDAVDDALAVFRQAAVESDEVDSRLRRHLAAEATSVAFGTAPWTTYAQSVVVFAHVVHDRLDEVRALGERLMATPVIDGGELTRIDFPVSGAMLVATGSWLLATGADPVGAVRRIAMGRSFGYPRYQPVFGWSSVHGLVEQHGQGELLDRTVEEFGELSFEERGELARSL